jgi:hypothetical protein
VLSGPGCKALKTPERSPGGDYSRTIYIFQVIYGLGDKRQSYDLFYADAMASMLCICMIFNHYYKKT